MVLMGVGRVESAQEGDIGPEMGSGKEEGLACVR